MYKDGCEGTSFWNLIEILNLALQLNVSDNLGNLVLLSGTKSPHV